MPKFLKENNGFPVEYEETDNFKIVEKKAERNSMLAETDVYMVEDFPTTKKTEWKTYRQKLRDMDFSDPNNITWPTKPN